MLDLTVDRKKKHLKRQSVAFVHLLPENNEFEMVDLMPFSDEL